MDFPPIRLFAYGTLKKGYGNHKRFCRKVMQVIPARVWGRLYLLEASYPALELPEESILAHGTDSLRVDADSMTWMDEIGRSLSNLPQPSGDWGWVYGEVLTFSATDATLSELDDLEGFVPGKGGLYTRVLGYVQTDTAIVSCWMYVQCGANEGRRIPSGEWPEHNPSRQPVDSS